MTDTLQAPAIPPTPPVPSRRNPALTGLTVLAVIAVLALGVVAVAAMTRDNNGTTMMGTNGMPGSMMSNGQMMNGHSMMNGSMMGHGSSSPIIPGAREIAVTASMFKFEPAEIHVKTGEDVTVVLTATDLTHDLTIDGLGFQVAAAPGQTGRGSFHAPATAGRYTAYCSVTGHRQAGMTATVVVDPA